MVLLFLFFSVNITWSLVQSPVQKHTDLLPTLNNGTLVWLLIQTQLWGARHAGIRSCRLRFEIKKKNLIKMSLNKKNFFLPFVLDRKQTSGTQGPRRTPAGLWTKARPDCGSELWPQLQRTSHLQDNEESERSETCMFFPHTGGCWFNSLTCLSPDWQVLVLLNVQHDLQAVTHTSFGGDQRRTSITSCIKGITLPIASKHLRHRRISQN